MRANALEEVLKHLCDDKVQVVIKGSPQVYTIHDPTFDSNLNLLNGDFDSMFAVKDRRISIEVDEIALMISEDKEKDNDT